MEELKPCPFCGRPAKTLNRTPTKRPRWEVHCTGCSAIMLGGLSNPMKDLVADWNRRYNNGFGGLQAYKGSPAACRGRVGRKREEEDEPPRESLKPLMCDSCKYNMNECDAQNEVVCEKINDTLPFGVAECISYEEN